MIPKIPTRDDFRGRFGDTKSAHVTPGEVVLPRSITDDPGAMAVIAQLFQDAGMDHRRYTVGNPETSVNPATGKEEFFDWRSIAGAFLPGLISDFLPSDIFGADSGLLNNILDVGLGAAGHNLLTGGDWTQSIGASLGSQAGRWAGREFFGGEGESAAPTSEAAPYSPTGNAQLDALLGRNMSYDPSMASAIGQAAPANYSSSAAADPGFNALDYALSTQGAQQQSGLRGALDKLGFGSGLNDMLFGAAGAYLGGQLAGGGMQMPEQKQLNIPNTPAAGVPQYGGGNRGPSMAPPSTGPSTSVGTQTGTSPSTQIGTSTGAVPTSAVTYQRATRNRDTGQQQWQGVNDPGRNDRRQGWGGGVVFV